MSPNIAINTVYFHSRNFVASNQYVLDPVPDNKKQEYTPLLRPGLHRHTVEELERLCVFRFPESLTRPGIMASLREIFEHMQRNGMRGDVWVDGSFMTEKLNPDDVDIVLVVNQTEFSVMTPAQRAYLDWFSSTSLYDRHRCDNYSFVRNDAEAESEYMHAYWLRQFGFSRGDQMKGLAVITLPYLVTP